MVLQASLVRYAARVSSAGARVIEAKKASDTERVYSARLLVYLEFASVLVTVCVVDGIIKRLGEGQLGGGALLYSQPSSMSGRKKA